MTRSSEDSANTGGDDNRASARAMKPASSDSNGNRASAKTTKPVSSDSNDGNRASARTRLTEAVERAESQVRAFVAVVRRSVEEAWQLGKDLLEVKDLLSHGAWLPWLKNVGLGERQAQRCMRLYRLDPEKRLVSDSSRSINETIRLLEGKGPTRVIDAEFKVESSDAGPGIGAGSDSNGAASSDLDTKEPAGAPSVSGSTSAGPDADSSQRSSVSADQSAPAGTEEPSSMPLLSDSDDDGSDRAETVSSPNRLPADTSGSGAVETDSAGDGVNAQNASDLRTGEDASVDAQDFAAELSGLLTRVDQVLGRDPVTLPQRLGPHLQTVSQFVLVLASAMIRCVDEESGDDGSFVATLPEEFVPTLQRLTESCRRGT